jgi:hypothetical protein
MEKGNGHMLMEESTLGIGRRIRNMGSGSTRILMEECMRGIGKMERDMEKAK